MALLTVLLVGICLFWACECGNLNVLAVSVSVSVSVSHGATSGNSLRQRDSSELAKQPPQDVSENKNGTAGTPPSSDDTIPVTAKFKSKLSQRVLLPAVQQKQPNLRRIVSTDVKADDVGLTQQDSANSSHSETPAPPSTSSPNQPMLNVAAHIQIDSSRNDSFDDSSLSLPTTPFAAEYVLLAQETESLDSVGPALSVSATVTSQQYGFNVLLTIVEYDSNWFYEKSACLSYFWLFGTSSIDPLGADNCALDTLTAKFNSGSVTGTVNGTITGWGVFSGWPCSCVYHRGWSRYTITWQGDSGRQVEVGGMIQQVGLMLPPGVYTFTVTPSTVMLSGSPAQTALPVTVNAPPLMVTITATTAKVGWSSYHCNSGESPIYHVELWDIQGNNMKQSVDTSTPNPAIPAAGSTKATFVDLTPRSSYAAQLIVQCNNDAPYSSTGFSATFKPTCTASPTCNPRVSVSPNFTLPCSCNGDGMGTPLDFTVWQNKDQLFYSFTDNSACETGYTFSADQIMFDYIPGSAACNTRVSRTWTHRINSHQFEVGTSHVFQLVASDNQDTMSGGYRSNATTVTFTIQWWGQVTGTVNNLQRMPVPDVLMTAYLQDSPGPVEAGSPFHTQWDFRWRNSDENNAQYQLSPTLNWPESRQSYLGQLTLDGTQSITLTPHLADRQPIATGGDFTVATSVRTRFSPGSVGGAIMDWSSDMVAPGGHYLMLYLRAVDYDATTNRLPDLSSIYNGHEDAASDGVAQMFDVHNPSGFPVRNVAPLGCNGYPTLSLNGNNYIQSNTPVAPALMARNHLDRTMYLVVRNTNHTGNAGLFSLWSHDQPDFVAGNAMALYWNGDFLSVRGGVGEANSVMLNAPRPHTPWFVIAVRYRVTIDSTHWVTTCTSGAIDGGASSCMVANVPVAFNPTQDFSISGSFVYEPCTSGHTYNILTLMTVETNFSVAGSLRLSLRAPAMTVTFLRDSNHYDASSSGAFAVDGNPATLWNPGPGNGPPQCADRVCGYFCVSYMICGWLGLGPVGVVAELQSADFDLGSSVVLISITYTNYDITHCLTAFSLYSCTDSSCGTTTLLLNANGLCILTPQSFTLPTSVVGYRYVRFVGTGQPSGWQFFVAEISFLFAPIMFDVAQAGGATLASVSLPSGQTLCDGQIHTFVVTRANGDSSLTVTLDQLTHQSVSGPLVPSGPLTESGGDSTQRTNTDMTGYLSWSYPIPSNYHSLSSFQVIASGTFSPSDANGFIAMRVFGPGATTPSMNTIVGGFATAAAKKPNPTYTFNPFACGSDSTCASQLVALKNALQPGGSIQFWKGNQYGGWSVSTVSVIIQWSYFFLMPLIALPPASTVNFNFAGGVVLQSLTLTNNGDIVTIPVTLPVTETATSTTSYDGSASMTINGHSCVANSNTGQQCHDPFTFVLPTGGDTNTVPDGWILGARETAPTLPICAIGASTAGFFSNANAYIASTCVSQSVPVSFDPTQAFSMAGSFTFTGCPASTWETAYTVLTLMPSTKGWNNGGGIRLSLLANNGSVGTRLANETNDWAQFTVGQYNGFNDQSSPPLRLCDGQLHSFAVTRPSSTSSTYTVTLDQTTTTQFTPASWVALTAGSMVNFNFLSGVVLSSLTLTQNAIDIPADRVYAFPSSFDLTKPFVIAGSFAFVGCFLNMTYDIVTLIPVKSDLGSLTLSLQSTSATDAVFQVAQSGGGFVASSSAVAFTLCDGSSHSFVVTRSSSDSMSILVQFDEHSLQTLTSMTTFVASPMGSVNFDFTSGLDLQSLILTNQGVTMHVPTGPLGPSQPGANEFAELLLYHDAHTDAEMAQVTTYLARQYNIAVDPPLSMTGAASSVTVGAGFQSATLPASLNGMGSFDSTGSFAITGSFVCVGSAAPAPLLNIGTLAGSIQLTLVSAGYMGCYADSSPRDLSTQLGAGGYTIATCGAAAISGGYRYFGLQYKGVCFMGNSYGKYGTSSGCTMACDGDTTQICGGGWANSIYDTTAPALHQFVVAQQGQFAWSSPTRALCDGSTHLFEVNRASRTSPTFTVTLDRTAFTYTPSVPWIVLSPASTVNFNFAGGVILQSLSLTNNGYGATLPVTIPSGEPGWLNRGAVQPLPPPPVPAGGPSLGTDFVVPIRGCQDQSQDDGNNGFCTSIYDGNPATSYIPYTSGPSCAYLYLDDWFSVHAMTFQQVADPTYHVTSFSVSTCLDSYYCDGDYAHIDTFFPRTGTTGIQTFRFPQTVLLRSLMLCKHSQLNAAVRAGIAEITLIATDPLGPLPTIADITPSPVTTLSRVKRASFGLLAETGVVALYSFVPAATYGPYSFDVIDPSQYFASIVTVSAQACLDACLMLDSCSGATFDAGRARCVLVSVPPQAIIAAATTCPQCFAFQKPVADVGTGSCYVSQVTCPQHTDKVGTFLDSETSTQSGCLARAQYYHGYCGNAESVITTATYPATRAAADYPVDNSFLQYLQQYNQVTVDATSTLTTTTSPRICVSLCQLINECQGLTFVTSSQQCMLGLGKTPTTGDHLSMYYYGATRRQLMLNAPAPVQPGYISLAGKKPTTQSSTLVDHEPDLAVDGDVDNPVLNIDTYSSTDPNANGPAWWQVDLQDTYAVSQIVILAASAQALPSLTVLVGDDPKFDNGAAVCSAAPSTVGAGAVVSFDCGDLLGRYVRIATSSVPLVLSEVLVFERASSLRLILEDGLDSRSVFVPNLFGYNELTQLTVSVAPGTGLVTVYRNNVAIGSDLVSGGLQGLLPTFVPRNQMVLGTGYKGDISYFQYWNHTINQTQAVMLDPPMTALSAPDGSWSLNIQTGDSFGSVEALPLTVVPWRSTNGEDHLFTCDGMVGCSSIVYGRFLSLVNVAFTDISVYDLSGRIYYSGTISNTNQLGCPVYNALQATMVCVYNREAPLPSDQHSAIECAATDSTGSYLLSVPHNLAVRVEVTYLDHTFRPADGPWQCPSTGCVDGAGVVPLVTQNLFQLNFMDTAVADLVVSVVGGNDKCNNFIGVADIQIQGGEGGTCPLWRYDDDNQPTTSLLVGDCGSGDPHSRFSLPRMPLTIKYVNLHANDLCSMAAGLDSTAVDTYIVDHTGQSSQNVDLTTLGLTGTPNVTFRYIGPITPVLNWWPKRTMCGDADVLVSGQTYTLDYSFSQQYGTGICNYVDGQVLVTDGLSQAGTGVCKTSDIGVCMLNIIAPTYASLPSHVSVTVIAGTPLFETTDHKKSIIFQWFGDTVQQPQPYQHDFVITGSLSLGALHSVQVPEYMPLLVLHDPPGGGSFTRFTAETSLTVSLQLHAVETTNQNGYDEAHGLGVDAELDGLFGIPLTGPEVMKPVTHLVDVGVWSTGAETGVENEHEDVITLTLQTEETVSTSPDRASVGHGADMFLLPSLTLVFGVKVILEENTIIPGSCNFDVRTSNEWNVNDTLNRPTFSWRSAYDIEHELIPQLTHMANTESNMDKKATLLEAVAGWNHTLARNAYNIKNAQPWEEATHPMQVYDHQSSHWDHLTIASSVGANVMSSAETLAQQLATPPPNAGYHPTTTGQPLQGYGASLDTPDPLSVKLGPGLDTLNTPAYLTNVVDSGLSNYVMKPEVIHNYDPSADVRPLASESWALDRQRDNTGWDVNYSNLVDCDHPEICEPLTQKGHSNSVRPNPDEGTMDLNAFDYVRADGSTFSNKGFSMQYHPTYKANILSFSGGGAEYTQKVTTSSEFASTRVFGVDRQHDRMDGFESENAVVIATIRADWHKTSKYALSIQVGSERSGGNSASVEFTLSDPDLGDHFEVKLLRDQIYGTPVFQTVAGASKCIWEANTEPRELPHLQATSVLQDKLPPGALAMFEVLLSNAGTTSESGRFGLDVDPRSNIDGLSISVHADQWTPEFVYEDVPNVFATAPGPAVDTNIPVWVTVAQTPGTYSYPTPFSLRMWSVCEREIGADSGLMSRVFCSDKVTDDCLQLSTYTVLDSEVNHLQTVQKFKVGWAEPCNLVQWQGDVVHTHTFRVVKAVTGVITPLQFAVSNPEYAYRSWADSRNQTHLTSVLVTFRNILDADIESNWQWAMAPGAMGGQGIDLVYAENAVGVAHFSWDVSGLSDGQYYLRVRTSCSNTDPNLDESFYSSTTDLLTGTVDVTPPQPWGDPLPVHAYIPGSAMQIGVSWSEPILCRHTQANRWSFNAIMSIAMNASALTFTPVVFCDSTNAHIGLAFPLSFNGYSYANLVGLPIHVSLSHVQDLMGNVADTVSWDFVAGAPATSLLAVAVRVSNMRVRASPAQMGSFGSPQRNVFRQQLIEELAQTMDHLPPSRIDLRTLSHSTPSNVASFSFVIASGHEHEKNATTTPLDAVRAAASFHDSLLQLQPAPSVSAVSDYPLLMQRVPDWTAHVRMEMAVRSLEAAQAKLWPTTATTRMSEYDQEKLVSGGEPTPPGDAARTSPVHSTQAQLELKTSGGSSSSSSSSSSEDRPEAQQVYGELRSMRDDLNAARQQQQEMKQDLTDQITDQFARLAKLLQLNMTNDHDDDNHGTGSSNSARQRLVETHRLDDPTIMQPARP